MPKIVALLPIHNEEGTLLEVLERADRHCDRMVLVNDASTDRTGAILERFARRRRDIHRIELKKNEGMAGALREGFRFILRSSDRLGIGPEDLVVTMDADGQHRPEYIPRLVTYLRKKRADIVLTRRDFSLYPRYKVLGNRFLTFTNSILSGHGYKDVESGLRLMKVKSLPRILRYYTGVKYSCAQEIALISARSGFRIDNGFLVKIAYYRPGTTLLDGFIVLGMSVLTFLRLVFGWERPLGFIVPWERGDLGENKGGKWT